jgi:hypothetical protein
MEGRRPRAVSIWRMLAVPHVRMPTPSPGSVRSVCDILVKAPSLRLPERSNGSSLFVQRYRHLTRIAEHPKETIPALVDFLHRTRFR